MLIDIIKTSKANVLNKLADHLTFEFAIAFTKNRIIFPVSSVNLFTRFKDNIAFWHSFQCFFLHT